MDRGAWWAIVHGGHKELDMTEWLSTLALRFYIISEKLILITYIHANICLPGSSNNKESACNAGDPGSILGWEEPMEKEMAIHSNILVWEIPWTEEPGGLQSMGISRVVHDLLTKVPHVQI